MTQFSLSEHAGSYCGIQFLRFLAAAAVLLAHVSLTLRERLGFSEFPILDMGLAGVNIFFAISGFVMVVSTRRLVGENKAWQDFAVRRIIRIVPIYWIATTLKLLIVLLIPALALHSAFDPFHTVASYLFIHARDEVGDISPLHAVGWTLNYEMFFYLLFATALFLRIGPMLMVGSVLGFLVFCGLFFDARSAPALVAYMQPIVLQFALGMAIGYLCLRKWKPKGYVPASLVMIGTFFILIVKVPTIALGWLSFLTIGIPSALIVAGVALLEPKLHHWIPAFLRELGDSSYSLYLFHPFILAATALIIWKIDLEEPLFVAFLMMLWSILGGWIIYRFIELPLTSFFRRLAKPLLLNRNSTVELMVKGVF